LDAIGKSSFAYQQGCKPWGGMGWAIRHPFSIVVPHWWHDRPPTNAQINFTPAMLRQYYRQFQ